jgi:tRNA pseudouridine55 synthase
MYNGVINIYKEKGYTSHDVVARMRGILKQKKIGHTGTLDPDAEGVLPVCLGCATRLCDILPDKTKTYRAVLLLGTTTDTEDAGGKILEIRDVHSTEEEVLAAVKKYEGDYLQTPPMYSAIKINGQKLVNLARKGITVERTPRKVRINSIAVEKVELPRITFTVDCSEGTYIRTLCSDIGRDLKCGGLMESLLRTRAGMFKIENSHRLSEIEDAAASDTVLSFLTPPDACFPDYPSAETLEEGDRYVHNGNPVSAGLAKSGSAVNGLFRLYDSRKEFIGIYETSGDEFLKPVKLFYRTQQE